MQPPRPLRKRRGSSSSEYSSGTNSNTSTEREAESPPRSPPGEDHAEPFFEDDDDIPRDETRGKKGLTHEEMAMARYGSHAEESTQSESDGERDEPQESTQEQPEVNEHHERIDSIEPVVAKAADLLEEKGLGTNAFGYAKLQGASKGAVDYLIRFKSVTIGRVGFGTDCELKSETKLVSRQHARLFWDERTDRWHITCLSKNGLLVDGTPVVPSAPPMPLTSQSLIEIGDVAFFFLLANGTILRVADIQLLEEKIIKARSMYDEYSEDDGYRDDHYVDEYGQYRASNGVKSRSKKQSRTSTGRSEPAPSKGGRKSSGGGHGSGKKSKPKASATKAKVPIESDSSTTDSESDEEEVIPDILDDIKYKPMLIPLPSNGKRKRGYDRSSGKKRRRKSRGAHSDSSDDDDESIGAHDDWIKKEKADFARALFAVGVDPLYDQEGNLTHFTWERFRGIAELSNKTDYELEEYYRRFMNDVHTLLDDEEREKRTKGPRTKHKKGCDCIVCLNTAKSRERKRAALNAEDRGGSEDDRETKSTARPNDKLVGLVTAQKLRVRMGIHEAALQVARDTVQASAVFHKLNASQQTTELKDFPQWWIVGYHDKALMRGVHRHGVSNWDNIWYDDTLSRFMRIREKDGAMVVWPSQQAVMKRVRDLSSSITAEMKKVAKKEREIRKYAKRKEKRMMKRKQREANTENHSNGIELPQREADISTAEESESEGERPAAEVETEDEDGVEVEVEEMEILDEDGGQASGFDADGEGEQTPTRRGVVGAADDTTDEEGDDADGEGIVEEEVVEEEVVEYETASDTGSE